MRDVAYVKLGGMDTRFHSTEAKAHPSSNPSRVSKPTGKAAMELVRPSASAIVRPRRLQHFRTHKRPHGNGFGSSFRNASDTRTPFLTPPIVPMSTDGNLTDPLIHKSIPTIDVESSVVVAMDLFPCSNSDDQDEIVDVLKQMGGVAVYAPGYVSYCVHKSVDGAKVAIYSQWESPEFCEAFQDSAAVKNIAPKLSKFGPPDSHIYTAIISESKTGLPTIKAGEYIVHFAEFRMPPENQPKMVELAGQNVAKAMDLDGLISANFHKSLDGERVINYGQWTDMEAIEELKTRPGFGGDSPYWEGVAENEHHLYNVVYAHPSG